MAWIEKKKRRDGGISARVVWRLGGTRDGAYQSETFAAGGDAQNLARADGFKKMVDAAGQRWPDGWVRGEGFVRPVGADPLTPPPRFVDIGAEYIRQIVDVSPGQRKRYLGHLKVLEATRVRGSLLFTKPVTGMTDGDLRGWHRLGSIAEDEGELPRPDPRGLRVRREARLPCRQPGNRHGAEAVPRQAVAT
jgi:hypothetical protein